MDVITALQTIVVTSSVTKQEEEKKALSAYLNHLLLNDFSALVQILYRVDVSEQKVKSMLKENPTTNAGDLLTELLIQRQREKTAAKQTPPSTHEGSLDNEAW